MPIQRVKPKHRADTRQAFQRIHGRSLEEVAQQAALPPRTEKNELPSLVVVEDSEDGRTEQIDDSVGAEIGSADLGESTAESPLIGDVPQLSSE